MTSHTLQCGKQAAFMANTLRLKRKTHYLAEAHLRRFTSDSSKKIVYVFNKRNRKIISVSPEAEGLFNVVGVWSHQAENIMTRIENDFWGMLDSSGSIECALDQEIVSEYYALWRGRIHYMQTREYFVQPLQGITPSELKRQLDVPFEGRIVQATQEELAELRGVGFYSTDLRASARSVSWTWLRWIMDHYKLKLRTSGVHWIMVHCEGATLVLPDQTLSLDIPVSPRTLIHGHLVSHGPPVCTIYKSMVDR